MFYAHRVKRIATAKGMAFSILSLLLVAMLVVVACGEAATATPEPDTTTEEPATATPEPRHHHRPPTHRHSLPSPRPQRSNRAGGDCNGRADGTGAGIDVEAKG